MKKQIAILATILATSGLSAFGQGYVLFTASALTVYNDTTGTGLDPSVANGQVDATFLWAATGATDPFGAGTATTGAQNVSGGFADITTALNSDGWTLAQNVASGTGSAPLGEADNTASSVGQLNYNTSTSFGLGSSAAGSIYEIVVIAWATEGGTITTLSEAEAGNTLGWSSSFDYTTGASSSTPVSSMSLSGLGKFGVAAVPEPTTLALAGLGGLSMLFLRRRKA